jgi:hypothetical protein
MKTYYTEKDFVIKDTELNNTVNAALEFLGRKIPGARNTITNGLKKSEKQNEIIHSEQLNLYFCKDKKRDEYNVIRRDFYESTNLLYSLFDLCTEFYDELDFEKEILDRESFITAFLSEIEKNEKLNLNAEKQMLKDLVREMLKTLSVYNQEELTEDEAASISDTVDRAFYAPITEILETLMEQLTEKRVSVSIQSE